MIRICFLLAFFGGAMVAVNGFAREGAAASKTPPAPTKDVVSDSAGDTHLNYADAGAGGSCGECCSTDMGCLPTDGDCCSSWNFEAGGIFLARNHASQRPSTRFDGVPNGQTAPALIYDTAHADLGTAAGYDMTLTRCFGPCWDLEARYFQMDGWNDSRSFQDYTRTSVSAYNFTESTTAPGYSYSSRMYNVELNLRWKQFERVPLLMGFRTLGVDENYRIISNGGLNTTWAETDTNNGLYGMQIGAEPVLWNRCGRFRLDGTIKAGLYGNTEHQRTRFPTVGGQWENYVEGSPSFVGEIGLIGTYQLNKCWSIRGGYEVLWLTSVVLAPDQASSISFGAPPIGVMNDNATLFYYGARASVERRF